MQKAFNALLQLINLLRLRFVSLHLLSRGKLELGALGAAENALQRVIVLGWNRIEFVIVALRASASQRQKPARGNVHPVIGQFRTQAVKPQTRRKALGVRKLVAGDLRLHKQVVGHVVAERLDYPITKAERIWIGQHYVAIHAVIGIAGYVQPITAPSFAILLAAQQSIHNTGKGIRIGIRHKGASFFVGWRKAGKIQKGAANQIGSSRRAVRFHLILFQLRQHETVNRANSPSGVCDRRWRGLRDRLKGPKAALFGRDHILTLRRVGGHRSLGPKGAILNPCRKRRNLGIGHFRLPHGHFHLFDGVLNGLHQQTLFRFAWHNSRTRFAALQ